MLLKAVLLFVAGVVTFTIPDGQPNGIYEVSYDASGVETHTLISHNVTSRGLVNSAKFPKRSFSSGAASKFASAVLYRCSITGLYKTK